MNRRLKRRILAEELEHRGVNTNCSLSKPWHACLRIEVLWLQCSLYIYKQRRMSGIEIVGLVLGSFPIILNCLDYYQEGLEPLEEWWHFRAHFIDFVDAIKHQMMRYNESIESLLDPIMPNDESIDRLVGDAKDPLWTSPDLAKRLEQRLAGEHGRFLRIMQRMEKEIKGLKKILGIKDGNVRVQRKSPRTRNILIILILIDIT